MDAAAATSSDCPAEHRDWVEVLRRGPAGGGFSLSSGLHDHGDRNQPAPPANSWACPPGNLFSVRGADYLYSKAKVPAGEWLLQPLAFDYLQGPSRIAHIMQHPQHCRVRAALDSAIGRHSGHPDRQPFVWVFNVQVRHKTFYRSSIFYYITFCSPPPGSLVQRFLDGDDAFRDSRLKALIRFPEAPRLVHMVVGQRWPVCILGKAFKCSYMRETSYIEVDVDICSSITMRTALNLTSGLLPHAVIDVAFLLEGVDPDELPERILGAIRLVRLDPSFARHFDSSAV